MKRYIKNTLFKLSAAPCAGAVKDAAELAAKELSKYADITYNGKNIIGTVGEGDHTLMLAAHIDEVSFIVTDIDENGFLTVSKCGGIDLRHLPSRRVIIHGKKKINGVFCSVPPHLKAGEENFDDIGEFKIDSCLGAEALSVISAGDTVTFDEKPQALLGSRVTGKALDNRAGVTALLETARRLSGKQLPIKVAFCLTDEEELGTRGARTAAFSVSPDEAIAVDVTFGTAPDVDPLSAKDLGSGAAIGVSPILSREIGDRLTEIANKKKTPFTHEIMSSRTGTDADVIAISKSGVKTGLLSIPIRNMHSPCEVAELADIEAVCDVLEEYILSGGMKNV